VGVEVLWQGRCSDYYVQQKLVERMIELDDVITAAHLKQADKEKSRILFRPENAVNKVMVSGSLFSDQKLPESLKQVNGCDFMVDEIRLFGITFSFVEAHPQVDEPDQGVANKVSIVFTRSHDPDLDGYLVRPVSLQKHHPLAHETQLVLETPRLYLSGHLQSWAGNYLGWINQFYVPKMEYWIGKQRISKSIHKSRPSLAGSLEKIAFTSLVKDLGYEMPEKEWGIVSEVVQTQIRNNVARGSGVMLAPLWEGPAYHQLVGRVMAYQGYDG